MKQNIPYIHSDKWIAENADLSKVEHQYKMLKNIEINKDKIKRIYKMKLFIETILFMFFLCVMPVILLGIIISAYN